MWIAIVAGVMLVAVVGWALWHLDWDRTPKDGGPWPDDDDNTPTSGWG